jgi:hypothetical protein
VPDTVVLGETFTLNVTASTPAHRAVGFPTADAGPSLFGDLSVVARSPLHTRRVGAGYAIDSVAYTVRASTPGVVRVPSLPVWVDAAVDTVVAHTRPRTVWVSSRPPDVTTTSKGEDEGRGLFWGVWAVLAAVLLGGGRVLWAQVCKTGDARETTRDGTAPTRRPYRAAMARLEALSSGAGPDRAAGRCVACADALRSYLTLGLGLAAQTSTTTDLVDMLRRHPDVPPDARRPIETVLQQADRVKFAGARPDAETANSILEATRAALNEIDGGEAAEEAAV